MIRKSGWIAALALAADRVTKALAWRIPPQGTVLIPGVIGLRQARNTGMAFSLLSGHPWLLGLLSLAIVAGACFFFRGKRVRPLVQTGLMLMLGGAVGNMIDRFLTGSVPDMVELLFMQFAIFNVADLCLVTGCILMAAALLLDGKVEETDDGSDF